MVETRIVEQVLVWKLILNPMTERTEAAELVAWSDDKEKLMSWYNSQLVEFYRDDNWGKTFSKGGILEWYNPMYQNGEIDSFGHGLHS